MNLLDLWEKAQPSIKETIGDTSYETWFTSLKIAETSDTALAIETPDEFYKNWIIDHYYPIIKEKLGEQGGVDVIINFTVGTSPQQIAETKLSPLNPLPKRKARGEEGTANLNPRFSFDNFVVGPSNRFAYAACMAVAESPAKAYNPLFVYGDVGLGKTHLMQAITHQIKINHPDLKSYFISSERFTNELIEAIRHRSTAQFRQKYRNIDVLLIDDIHFIAGKESTQEEFFHTFNSLHNNRKQIIISSDRPPKEIAKLEERLSSRFAWGLITDIQPPDYETRIAILRKKLEREPVSVPEDVICFIAEQIKTNIRELEGALIRVVAYSLLEEKGIDLEMTKVVLKDMVKQTVKTISVEMVQKNVADHFRLSIGDLKTKRRNRNIIIPRQIAMYIVRKLTKLSLPEIGSAFGGKDHTTVLHACRKIEKEIQGNKETNAIVSSLIMELNR